MKIRKVTIGLQLYSIPVTYTFLAYVQSNKTNTNVVAIPIGKQIIYAIMSQSYIAYTDLPIMIYRQYQWVDVKEKEKFLDVLKIIISRLNELKITTYKSSGVQLQYIYWEPLLTSDGRVTTLVAGVTPSQPIFRALIDVVDQLYDHNPKANITLTFYVVDSQTLYLPELERKFYINQIVTRMEFTYDGKYLYFFNTEVGKFKYAIVTGEVHFTLTKQFQTYLLDLFKKNYTDLSPDIIISIMAIQANVNYDTILYAP